MERREINEGGGNRWKEMGLSVLQRNEREKTATDKLRMQFTECGRDNVKKNNCMDGHTEGMPQAEHSLSFHHEALPQGLHMARTN